MNDKSCGLSRLLVCLVLAAVTLATFWPATRCDFVNYDDPLYVTDNPHVRAGLTWKGLAWAFGQVHGEKTYWHPLTWVSHMVDCQLYRLKPWGHHLTSVLLHAANAVLVFLVFRRMTGAFWPCAVLAALFALHPLQVDSVAWAAERKTLLSAFFWLLTTWAYVRYAERQTPKPKVQSPKSPLTLHASHFYFLSLFFFLCGLMCKPVLVTLPFVLLLLDYWPLHRFKLNTQDSKLKTLVPLVREKTPFLALALASSVITILAHDALRALESVSNLPWDLRVENALVSYVRYLGKTFWPSGLAVFYPYPRAWPAWEVVTCGLLLVVICGLVLGTARRRPWLLVGWFWFLGVLVPFIGLVQAGAQAMADRFMYVPILGVFLLVIWGLRGLAGSRRYQLIAGAGAASAAIVLCLVLTRQQLGHWRDSETLFRHALAVTENSDVAHNNLGFALFEKGELDEPIRHFQEALRLKPDNTEALNNLGAVFIKQSRWDEAIGQLQEVLRLQPDFTGARFNLGIAFQHKGQTDKAIREFQGVLRLDPDHNQARNNLAAALYDKDQTDEAISQFQEILRRHPDDATALGNLGHIWTERGKNLDQARALIEKALQLEPGNPAGLDRMGWVLYKLNRPREALDYLLQAIEKSAQPDALHYDHVGDIYAALGQREAAAAAWRTSVSLAQNPQIQKKLGAGATQ